MFQPRADRIAPFGAAGNDFFHLSRFADDLLDFIETISSADQNNFVHAIRALEGSDGVRDDWFAADQREQFVEAHSFAQTRCDNYRAQHDQNRKRPTSNSEFSNSTLSVER